jgi:hypothetical protein
MKFKVSLEDGTLIHTTPDVDVSRISMIGDGWKQMGLPDSYDFPVPPPVPVLPAVGSNAGIMWGVNVHCGRGGAYANLGNAGLKTLTDSIGFKSVRTDLYTASSNDQGILTAALASGLKVLPIVMADMPGNNPDSYADETAAYNAGHAMGLTYGTNFRGQVSVWEVGNEWQDKIGYTEPGSTAAAFNQGKLIKVRGVARGLIEGLKAGDPACKVAFGSNSEIAAWGWLDFLWAGGVRWDITSLHYYTTNGDAGFNITNLPLPNGVTNLPALMHSKFGVPNWITESNWWPNGADQATKAAYISNAMPWYDSIAKANWIEGMFWYELLEEGDAFGVCSGTGTLLAEGTAVKNYLTAHPSVVYR